MFYADSLDGATCLHTQSSPPSPSVAHGSSSPPPSPPSPLSVTSCHSADADNGFFAFSASRCQSQVRRPERNYHCQDDRPTDRPTCWYMTSRRTCPSPTCTQHGFIHVRCRHRMRCMRNVPVPVWMTMIIMLMMLPRFFVVDLESRKQRRATDQRL